MQPPRLPARLQDLPWPQRIVEVLWCGLLALEYSLSPGGGFRAWLRLNLTFALVLGLPSLLLVPVVTSLANAAYLWTTLLLQIVLNLLYAALVLTALVLVLLLVTRLLTRRR